MNNEGRGNPEYLAVLSEVVTCLFRQLHHPMLTMDARQITDWFHHVRLEDVQEILEKDEASKRQSSTAAKQP